MEVFVSPTFSIDVSSPSPYDVPPHDEQRVVVPPPLPSLFLEEEAEGRAEKTLISRRIGSDFGVGGTEDSSGSSSSIGAPDDSDEEEDDSVVSSSNAGLGSLDSLEDSLPIKRGLSNHCCGKSKSFANLSDVSWALGSAKDLEKPENPFNKRRRILMANKRSRKSSSFYSWHDNPKSMPLLASLNEEDDDVEVQEEDDDEEDQESPVSSSSSSSRRHQEDHEKLGVSPKAQMGSKFTRASFKSQSCFSLPGLEFQRHK